MFRKITELSPEDQLTRLRRRSVPLALLGSGFLFVLGASNFTTENWLVGAISIPLSVLFVWNTLDTSKAIKADTALREMAAQVNEERLQKAKAARRGGAVKVVYQAGLEHLNLTLKAPYSLHVTDTALVLERVGARKEIPWVDVESVDAGTDDELRSRLTVTRLALIGIFAFGVKKERKQNFYVTISTKDSIGVFDLVSSGKNQVIQKQARAFAVTCNSKAKSTIK